jgi:hypothetical protein
VRVRLRVARFRVLVSLRGQVTVPRWQFSHYDGIGWLAVRRFYLMWAWRR